jgi:hypothetical protein
MSKGFKKKVLVCKPVMKDIVFYFRQELDKIVLRLVGCP